jgi:hypothetical protein
MLTASNLSNFVLAGLVPATHALGRREKDVDARIKSAQDDLKSFPVSATQVVDADDLTASPSHCD